MRSWRIILAVFALLWGSLDAFAIRAVHSENPCTGDFGSTVSRARYYQPQTGRFWTMDTYEGNSEDPLSLHKYLYCSGNPVNHVDPSGYTENAISQAFSAGLQFTLQTINAASRVVPALNWRLAYTVWRVQQNLWKVEAVLAGLQAASILTDAGLQFLDSAARRAIQNAQASTAVDGGPLFEQVVGANSTGYQTIDHLVTEPGNKVTVVSLTTRGDTPAMTDDAYIQRVEGRLMEKASAISTGRVFTPKPGVNLPTIEASRVAGRVALLGIPDTRAYLATDSRMIAMLQRVQSAIPNVRSAIVPLRSWRPGR